MAEVDVEINGRSYRFACQDGDERRLAALAKLLDLQARKASAHAGAFSETRVLAMAGLLTADALDEAETELRRLEAETATVRAVVTAALTAAGAPAPDDDAGLAALVAAALDHAAARIEGVAETLEADAAVGEEAAAEA